jgi:regulator of protease activity HflC (stomatin/prohibitin superfamily)
MEVLRHEIKDIQPPPQIKRSMELQSEAERVKRSKVLHSEGEKTSKINIAEGYKQRCILEGEGKAQQITQEARSVVETLRTIGSSMVSNEGVLSEEALRLRLSE